MPPVVISTSVTLRTFNEYLNYANHLEVSRSLCAAGSTTLTPVKNIVENVGYMKMANYNSDTR